MEYKTERPLLGAHVSGVTAQWINVRLTTADVDDTCRHFQTNGKPELALELRQSMASIRAAAALYIQRREEAASANGSPELPKGPGGEESNQKYLSVTDGAGLLGLSDRRVRQILAAGKLRGVRRGRQWLITSEDLEDYRTGKTA